MASQTTTTTDRLVIDPKWRKLPIILLIAGAVIALASLGYAAAFKKPELYKQFAYSYLLAFMFFLSLCLGGLFLVIMHHLFDAAWSVPVRRVAEHMACLLPVMAILFIPIAIMARPLIYNWMQAPPTDHALHAKHPIFTMPGFYIIALALFAIWTWLSWSLRRNSLNQDKDGAAIWTYKMRKLSAGGIYIFAVTLTLGAIMWMKALEHQWFSTMYGVYYFAASVWVTLATLYLIARLLQLMGPLSGVVHTRQIHDIGVLLFAFTVFYAYIHFSQYFLIWNAAIPEETFYYVKREFGTWWQICLALVFGHFFIPFLFLLRIDFKLKLFVMIPLCAWAWVMHFCDMSFNIMPLIHKDNFVLHPLDIACMMFFAGVLSMVFIKFFNSHPPYPIKDPRLGEALGVHHAGVRAPIAAND
jgi:hypothetical protein